MSTKQQQKLIIELFNLNNCRLKFDAQLKLL